MNKKLYFNMIFLITGTFLLAAMGIIVAANFIRDARILQQPLLSAVADEGRKSGSADRDAKPEEYKTFKYRKPASTENKKTAGAEVPQKNEQQKSASSKNDAQKSEKQDTAKTEKIKVEIINYTGIKGLAEEVASMLSTAGYETSFRDETSKDPVSTTIIDRNDKNAGLGVRKILKAGTVARWPDPKSVYDVTVKIGIDFRP